MDKFKIFAVVYADNMFRIVFLDYYILSIDIRKALFE